MYERHQKMTSDEYNLTVAQERDIYREGFRESYEYLCEVIRSEPGDRLRFIARARALLRLIETGKQSNP